MYTYSLVCLQTGQRICIGQGSGSMTKFYKQEADLLDRLGHFLAATQGRPLILKCDVPSAEHANYDEFEMDGGLIVTTKGANDGTNS